MTVQNGTFLDLKNETRTEERKVIRDVKFDLNDIVLIPAEKSRVSSRSECDVTTTFDTLFTGPIPTLPLMAAPMDTVVCKDNLNQYISQQIIPCVPRGTKGASMVDRTFYFMSFGLCEIETQLDNYIYTTERLKVTHKCKGDTCHKTPRQFYDYPNVLIDIANGHMEKLIPLVQSIKHHFPNLQLMVGNVANPETFANLGLAGADYVRCSVGTGAGCTTAANVSINYPMGSLISECHAQKKELELNTKIVADGGMKNYSDIIKALALGADYVMIGSIFNKAIGSSGFNYLYGVKLRYKLAKKLWLWGFPVKKKYRGMSTKAVQRSWGKTRLVTAEGITKYQKVEYTLEQWTQNFRDYLRSAMSYCDAKKLDEFIGLAQYVFITNSAMKRFDK